MRRLVSLWVVPLVVLVLLLLPGSAEAFHVAKLFADPPGAGGGGRIFYLGRPIERGWDCTACHTEAPGRIEVALDVQPASLFDDFHYQLGQSYVFTVQLVGEHLGFSAGMSNFNAISLAFADTEGLTQGGYSGFDSNELTEASGVLTTTGRAAGVTSWTFTWTAPTEPGAGEITLYLGVVDGNGADS
ncbi:MAG: hypothetical protein KDE53_19755, partial [Caldilineaceae bacterium]|nr:hypothetical protein [Caldilineaceae bacterium]